MQLEKINKYLVTGMITLFVMIFPLLLFRVGFEYLGEPMKIFVHQMDLLLGADLILLLLTTFSAFILTTILLVIWLKGKIEYMIKQVEFIIKNYERKDFF